MYLDNNWKNSYLLIINHLVTFGRIQEPTSLLLDTNACKTPPKAI